MRRIILAMVVAASIACDPGPLVPTGTQPPEGAEIGRSVDVAFSRPVDPRTLAGVQVRQERGGVDVRLSLLDGGTTLRVDLAGVPDPGELRLELPAALRGLEGEQGAARTFTFVVPARADTTLSSPRFRLEGARLTR